MWKIIDGGLKEPQIKMQPSCSSWPVISSWQWCAHHIALQLLRRGHHSAAVPLPAPERSRGTPDLDTPAAQIT